MRHIFFRLFCQQLYLLWGAVVVGAVTLATGAFIPSIIGYVTSMTIVLVGNKFVK